jgi:hypothetical protein
MVKDKLSIIWGVSKLLLLGAMPFSLYLKPTEPLLITNEYKSSVYKELIKVIEVVPK